VLARELVADRRRRASQGLTGHASLLQAAFAVRTVESLVAYEIRPGVARLVAGTDLHSLPGATIDRAIET
jgi:hypothetical protein